MCSSQFTKADEFRFAVADAIRLRLRVEIQRVSKQESDTKFVTGSDVTTLVSKFQMRFRTCRRLPQLIISKIPGFISMQTT